LKFSTVDFLDSFLGYIVQCSGRRGVQAFLLILDLFLHFFLSKSPHLFSYKAFSFFQQALLDSESKPRSHFCKSGNGDRVYFVQSSKVKSGIWIKSLELRVTRVI
jgi:hypothetical protein